MKKLIAAIVFWPCLSYADGIGFTNVTESEFKDVIAEFGSAWSHTSVSPASSLGDMFGFEIGVIAGGSKTETIGKIAKELDASADADMLPHAGILGVVSFPLGISAEINFLPEIKNSDVDFTTGSVAVKWTFTNLLSLPVDMALKAFGGSSKIKWNQVVSSVAANVEYEQQVSGLVFQVSKKLGIFEPYLSLGSVRATGKMTSSTGSVFDPSYSSASESEEEVAGSQFMLGANLNLFILRLGLESGKVLGAQTTSLKVSLFF